MLFELLDERPSLKMNSNNARKSLSKRIAWGYLLPVGNKGHIHIGMKEGWKKDDKFNDKVDRRIDRRRRRNDDDEGKEDSKVEMNVTIQENPKVLDKSLRIQLYAVREDDGIIGYMQRRIMNWPSYSSSYNSAYPNGIPEVYIQWRRQKKIILNDAALKFSIGPRNIETVVDFGGLPLVEAASAEEVGQGSTHGVVANILDVQNKGETSKLRAAVMRRSRSHREPCVVPEKLLHRLDAGPEGAMVVAYSHSGHLLAVSGRTLTLNAPLSDHNSSVASNIVYSLKLFDTDIGVEVWCMNSAHHSVVYDIRWSKDDSYIVTCSGDGTTKIWDVECYVRMGAIAVHGTPGKGNNTDTAMSPGVRHQPYLAHVLRTVPPLYVYCAIFQEYTIAPSTDMVADVKDSYEKQRAELPRVITGSSDGRIRVWNGSKLLGTLRIGDNDDPPHENRINSIVIDERTRYLLSGDSDGEILMWRADPKGWYQLLRKFRKDPSVASLKNVNLGALDKKHVVSGVMSMIMHPDRNKAQMTVLTNKPTSLRVYSMTTYKTLSQCHGIISSSDQSSGLCRAQISGDGNYVVCGSSINASEDKYCLRVWETQTGNVEACSLSDIIFPYPVRSVSWHPKQHVIAVGMVGQGSAVAVYAAHREVAERAVARINALAAATVLNKDDEREDIPSSNTSIASFNTQSTAQNKQSVAKAPPKTPLAPIKENVKGMLNSKTKEILDKISQAKSEIQ
jgi:WD40 repeat protein